MEKIKAAEQTRRAIQMFVQTLTDDEAMEISTLYPKYKVGKEYKVDELFTYGENAVCDPQLYRVVQAHTSQEGWTPDTAASLFAKVLTDPTGETILEWVQPDSTNPYMKGDKVTHNGVTYISTTDNNVWEPGVYGWEVMEG